MDPIAHTGPVTAEVDDDVACASAGAAAFA
jgi:hypothetical protein